MTRTFQISCIVFLVTLFIGLVVGTTSTGWGAINGLALLVAVVSGIVLLVRRMFRGRTR